MGRAGEQSLKLLAAPLQRRPNYQDGIGMRQLRVGMWCPFTPHPFRAVGVWYERFDQCSDEEVRRLLAT